MGSYLLLLASALIFIVKGCGKPCGEDSEICCTNSCGCMETTADNVATYCDQGFADCSAKFCGGYAGTTCVQGYYCIIPTGATGGDCVQPGDPCSCEDSSTACKGPCVDCPNDQSIKYGCCGECTYQSTTDDKGNNAVECMTVMTDDSICPITVTCTKNEDCGSNEWCRQTGLDTTIKECVSYSAEGESCGGFTMPQYYEQCAPDKTCADLNPCMADEPGICATPCEIGYGFNSNGECIQICGTILGLTCDIGYECEYGSCCDPANGGSDCGGLCQQITGCTEDALVCPDGSAVGRDASNNCEFYPCPDIICGTIQGLACPDRYECIYDTKVCDPENGGRDCGGVCESCGPPFCTLQYDPVCCDGVTYGNLCGAEANCCSTSEAGACIPDCSLVKCAAPNCGPNEISYTPDGECCEQCFPKPDCSAVICLKPECVDDEELYTPEISCCPMCRPITEPETTTEPDICSLPAEVGMCKAAINRWYYNAKTETCEIFTYGGCGGNKNNFETQDECKNSCDSSDIDVCELEKVIGPCEAAMPRFYYNSDSGDCEQFTYGGCEGNQNNFETMNECENRCFDICDLSADTGPCDGAFDRYFYNAMSGECESFSYGGCQGNANNFETEDTCQTECASAECIIPGEPWEVVDSIICSFCFSSVRGYQYCKKIVPDVATGKCDFMSNGWTINPVRNEAQCFLDYCKEQNENLPSDCEVEDVRFVKVTGKDRVDQLSTGGDVSDGILTVDQCTCDMMYCEEPVRGNVGRLGVLIGFGLIVHVAIISCM